MKFNLQSFIQTKRGIRCLCKKTFFALSFLAISAVGLHAQEDNPDTGLVVEQPAAGSEITAVGSEQTKLGTLDLPEDLKNLPASCRSSDQAQISNCVTVLAVQLQLVTDQLRALQNGNNNLETSVNKPETDVTEQNVPDVCQVMLSKKQRDEGEKPDAAECLSYLAGRLEILDAQAKNLTAELRSLRLNGRGEPSFPTLTPEALCEALERKLKLRAAADAGSAASFFDEVACAANPMAELRRAMANGLEESTLENRQLQPIEKDVTSGSSKVACEPPDAVTLHGFIEAKQNVFGDLLPTRQNLLINLLSQGTAFDVAIKRAWPDAPDPESVSALLCGEFSSICAVESGSCP